MPYREDLLVLEPDRYIAEHSIAQAIRNVPDVTGVRDAALTWDTTTRKARFAAKVRKQLCDRRYRTGDCVPVYVVSAKAIDQYYFRVKFKVGGDGAGFPKRSVFSGYYPT